MPPGAPGHRGRWIVGVVVCAAVAVVADTVWGAMEGRRLLNVNWDDGPNKDLNTAMVMLSPLRM